MTTPSNLRFVDTINQNILLHPFTVLRRTCQVNRKCSPLICVQPFSLIPFLFHQQQKQGIFALYRGLTSELLVKGIALGTETVIANYLEWPREVTKPRTLVQDSLKVIALRCLSVALTTPFLCSAVIETVQSVIIVSDRPSFVDCLRDGFLRLIHLRHSPSSRVLPIWLIVLPTVFYHISHSVLTHILRISISWFKKNIIAEVPVKKKARSVRLQATRILDDEFTASMNHSSVSIIDNNLSDSKCDSLTSTSNIDIFEKDSNLISTSILASFIADVVLLPVETVLNSIYIQGTRTIIDNCDETTVVLPVLTNYDGFSDCLQSIVRFEGTLGLFKGFGAILLQYSIHYLVFKSSYTLLKEFQKHVDGRSDGQNRDITRNNRRLLS